MTNLITFATDLRENRLPRASLFWLRIFLQHAQNGGLRSDVWLETGLKESQILPGLDAIDPTPRLKLLANYGLFQATRLKDQKTFSGADLATLDWHRKYILSLTEDPTPPESIINEVETLWAELGGTTPEAQALAELLTTFPARWGKNLPKRAYLLEFLHEAQAIYGGWLPKTALTKIAHTLKIPLADVYGVTEFYTMFHTESVGQKHIALCQDAACAMHGGPAVEVALCQKLGIAAGQISADGAYSLEHVRCLGLCDHAPAALVNKTRHLSLSPANLDPLLTNRPHHPQDANQVGGLIKIALANVNLISPTNLDDYRAQGGLAAWRKVLAHVNPAEVIEIIKASKLVGRGGAAFPTGLKWQFTAANPPSPRYVICNADESEVGAFKDRVLMDGDPFRIIEGLAIACYAVGAEQGFIYIRGEHRLGYERFAKALQVLEAAGWLGDNIQGRGVTCRIALRRGAGAYICGEETALMESIEGKRGFPRLRPPFPTTHGLWGQPTVINNVETLAKVPSIIIYGGDWYQKLGRTDSAGTKLFAVSGAVRRPGVYEVPFGIPLRHLIEDLAGGIPKGQQLQAILTGGAAGTFLLPEHLDTPITFESFKDVGGTIGAGTMIVFNQQTPLRGMLSRISDFFAHESCGKCYPCQMGTQRQAEILARLEVSQGQPDDLATLLELGHVMNDTSICGLGQSASWAICNAIERKLI